MSGTPAADSQIPTKRLLVSDCFIEELSHQLQRLSSFRKLEVIPEGMGKSLEHDQLGVISGAQHGTMQNRRIAEQQVACAGDQKARRHAAQIGVQRRQDGILAIGLADIFIIGKMIWIGGLQLAGEAVQSEQLPRVTDLAEVSERRKDTKGTRK